MPIRTLPRSFPFNLTSSFRPAFLVAAAGLSIAPSSAMAQWIPDYQIYTIQRTGLFGLEQTGSAGLQFSNEDFLSTAGYVAGFSERYTDIDDFNGENTWVYNPVSNTTVQTGLTGAANTDSAGFQESFNDRQNAAGYVTGNSIRYTDMDDFNGQNTWVYNPISNTTVQTGLTGAAYTGSAGFQFGENRFQNDAGQVAGYSIRYTDMNDFNGQNTWVYNPISNTTVQTGLTGAANTGSAGFQQSTNDFQNDAGQVAGSSTRYTGVDDFNGVNTWVYNPISNTTVQTGLTGAAYTGSAGFQFSFNELQNDAGQVAGSSVRYTGVNTFNGNNTWVYNPISNTTVQTGLTGAANTGSAGFQRSFNDFQNAAGQVAGYSMRSPTSDLNTNGRNTWVYNPVSNTTVQTGLTGAAYTGSAGAQYGENRLHNDAGQVAGRSNRYTGVSTFNGQNTWVYNPVSNTTVQTGLTAPANTGSTGRQESFNGLQNDAGQVAGTSSRYIGVSGFNGQNTWVYNPISNTTVQTGLTGAAYTGSAGFQFSFISFQNAAGQVAGGSNRITGVNTANGNDTWYFDPITSSTIAIIGSIRTADSFASSLPTILTDDGFLLGNYQFFAGGIGSGEQRAFIFRPDLGLTDLGNLVSGGLTANGWSTLRRPVFSDALRTIVGYGYVNGQTEGQSVFILVPAPAAAALLGLGGLMAAKRRRR